MPDQIICQRCGTTGDCYGEYRWDCPHHPAPPRYPEPPSAPGDEATAELAVLLVERDEEIKRLRGIVAWCRRRIAPTYQPYVDQMLGGELPADVT